MVYTKVNNILLTTPFKDSPQYIRFEAMPKITATGIDGFTITLVDNSRKIGQQRAMSVTGTDILALRDLLNEYFPVQ